MTPPVVILATQNAKKGKELAELASGHVIVKTLGDVGLADIVIHETGTTFEENARIKADAVAGALPSDARAHIHAVLADDSGLLVDALCPLGGRPLVDGKPGVRSARFASDHGTGEGDAANNALLLLLLETVPDERRTARFASAVCARILSTGAYVESWVTVEGRIARDLVGTGGFGYDPLFLPTETPGRRMAELSPAEKHAISHRGRAMRDLLMRLLPSR